MTKERERPGASDTGGARRSQSSAADWPNISRVGPLVNPWPFAGVGPATAYAGDANTNAVFGEMVSALVRGAFEADGWRAFECTKTAAAVHEAGDHAPAH